MVDLKPFEHPMAIIGTVCVVLSCLLSIQHLLSHLRNIASIEQINICRILLMVPIYSIDSAISMWNAEHEWTVYITVLRECYEGYVLYNFLRLMIFYCGGDAGLLEWLKTRPAKRYAPPCCCIRLQPGQGFLLLCMKGIMQYVFVRPIMALISLLAFAIPPHIYKEGEFHWTGSHSMFAWSMVIINVSQVFALYYLAVFYDVCIDTMRHHAPLMKFISIKMVVFFSFWQGLTIAFAFSFGVLDKTTWDQEIQSKFLNDFLLCVEMFIAAVFHKKVFPVEPYLNQLSLGSKQTSMIESESGKRESGFRPVQAVTDFFVSLLLIGVNIKKVTKQNDMIQDLSIMKKGVDPSIKYATYSDDVAIEMNVQAGSGAGDGDDDADESFDMKTYDITFNKELAGSSSDDDATKSTAAAPAAAGADGSSSSSMVTDHLAKAQKKTMDMSSFMQQLRARTADDDTPAPASNAPAATHVPVRDDHALQPAQLLSAEMRSTVEEDDAAVGDDKSKKKKVRKAGKKGDKLTLLQGDDDE